MTQEASVPPPPLGAATPAWQPAWDQVPPAPTGPSLVDSVPASAAARVVIAALAAGVLGQLLFVGQAGGINVMIWVVAVLAGAYVLRPAGARFDRADAWLPVAAIVFAAFIAIRHDRGLLAFDLVAAGLLTLASAVAFGGHPVTRRPWTGIVGLGFGAIAVAFVGAVKMVPGVRPLVRLLQLRGESVAARIIRGALLAIPVSLVFLLLFIAADAVFARIASELVEFELGPNAVFRTLFALFVAWIFAGTMAAVRLSRIRFPVTEPSRVTGGAVSAPPSLGVVETTVVLLALDFLFGAFVVIQAAYLFPGGDPLALTGLTYSEYARRGFFELSLAAAMAGIVILALDSVVERRTIAYKAAAGVVVLLIGVVLVSAVWRLALYQQAYGWTDIRFFVVAAIVWLGIGALACLVGLVVDRVRALPKVMVGAGLAIALACNVIGPQSFVAAQNLQRVIDPSLVPPDGYSGLDAAYITSLGADALTVLFSSLDRVPQVEAAVLESRLRSRADKLRRTSASHGWPSWNYSKDQVLNALDARGF